MSAEARESREAQPLSEPAAAVQPPPSGRNDGAPPGSSGQLHTHHSAIQFRFLEQLAKGHGNDQLTHVRGEDFAGYVGARGWHSLYT